MSVLAGCSLFNGVMILADARATIQWPSKKPTFADNLQKVFPITSHTVIGFVGNVEVAGIIIRELLFQIRKRNPIRKNGISLTFWIPRFLRALFQRLSQKNEIVDPPAFMVGSVVLDKPNIVERKKAVEIMERFRLGKISVQRNWLPGILVEIIKTPPETKYVILQDIPLNILYYLLPPDFIPRYLAPLEFVALGSGEGAKNSISEFHDIIFAGEVGNSFLEAFHLREVVSSFIESQNIETVGGLYPGYKINGEGITPLSYSCETPVGGTKISLSISQEGQWIQKNETTGKEIKLICPWELDPTKYRAHLKFDDLKDLGKFWSR